MARVSRRHGAIDEREYETFADEVSHRLDRREAGQHVADVPLLEEGEGKANQVMKELRSKREVERVFDDDDDERPKPGYERPLTRRLAQNRAPRRGGDLRLLSL